MKYRNTQAVLSSGKRKRVLKKARIFSNVERTFEEESYLNIDT